MKKAKLITLTVFLLLILNDGYSQQLVKDGAQWNITRMSWQSTFNSHSLKIEGDTMINNNLYKKVFLSNDSLNINWEQTNDYLREDDMKRIYWTGGFDEVLLYDFSLSEGDTFLVVPYLPDTCKIVVTEVDSVEIDNGEMRRRLKVTAIGVSFPEEVIWIEGIGSMRGLINHFYAYCAVDHPDQLLCHYDNGELTYQHNPSGCFLVSSVKEIEKQNGIKIYPNPIGEVFTIEVIKESPKVESIFIYSLTGKLVEERKLNDKSLETVDISKYQSGMYFLLLQLKTGSFLSKRIIKL